MSARIAIAVPTTDMVRAKASFDLMRAVVAALMDGITVIPLQVEGSLLASQRTTLVQQALEMDATHICFVDSDMRIPENIFARLMFHVKPETPVIAANCARRRMPVGPTAYRLGPQGKEDVYTLPDSHGLERVDCVGTGVMMIDAAVFSKIQQPWFATPWNAEMNQHMGEDIWFCKLLAKAGIPLYIDHDVSREVGHSGEWDYSHDQVNALRDAMAPAPLIQEAGAWRSQPTLN